MLHTSHLSTGEVFKLLLKYQTEFGSRADKTNCSLYHFMCDYIPCQTALAADDDDDGWNDPDPIMEVEEASAEEPVAGPSTPVTGQIPTAQFYPAPGNEREFVGKTNFPKPRTPSSAGMRRKKPPVKTAAQIQAEEAAQKAKWLQTVHSLKLACAARKKSVDAAPVTPEPEAPLTEADIEAMMCREDGENENLNAPVAVDMDVDEAAENENTPPRREPSLIDFYAETLDFN